MSSLPINPSNPLTPAQTARVSISLPSTLDSSKPESLPALLAVEQSPAAKVSLSTSIHPAGMGVIDTFPNSPPVYEKPSAPVNFLRDRGEVYTGKAGTRASQNLMNELSSLQHQKTPFRASPFLHQLGALSRETTAYSNEVRSYRVPGDIAAQSFNADFTGYAGPKRESVGLTIHTKEGDTIRITLEHRKGESESLAFSFEVTGELSEQEQAALDKLAAKLGDVADEFFRTGSAELRGLGDVDDDTIDSFNLSLSKPGGKDFVTLTYDYELDEATQTRRLRAEDTFGYQFDISANFNSLVNTTSSVAHQSLEQYLELIRRAGDTQGTESSSVRFMIDGLRSMLMPDSNRTPPALAQNSVEALLVGFDTGLPDFQASFNSPVIRNREKPDQAAAMALTMGQKTRVEVRADQLLVQQESFYELHNSGWKSLTQGRSPSLETGNYIYFSEHESGKTTRTLDIKAGQVRDLIVGQEHQRKYREVVFHDFVQVDERKENTSDRQLLNLLDQLHPQPAHQRHSSLIALLQSSRETLVTSL